MKNYRQYAIHKINVARQLLMMGNPIIDISKNKHNSDKTVFFFRATDKFFKDLKETLEEQ